MKKAVLAGDLGGTNLRMASVAVDGSILFRTRTQTPRSNGPEKIVEAMATMAAECRSAVKSEFEYTALGMAVPAILDGPSGGIHRSPNLPELNGVDLAGLAAERLAMPAILENDATSAAVGECWLGASRGALSSICVTLGTGVGGGILIGGEPLRGIDRTAGEIGHICVEPFGEQCGCGSHGCLEQYSSARAIMRMTADLSAEFPDSELNRLRELSPSEVFKAGISGDALATEIFRRVGFYLGIALAGLVNVLNPEIVVIGGGVSAGWDLFIEETTAQIRERAFQRPAERVRLVRAGLGDDSGILGAARLAIDL